jgi:hypothetical protein
VTHATLPEPVCAAGLPGAGVLVPLIGALEGVVWLDRHAASKGSNANAMNQAVLFMNAGDEIRRLLSKLSFMG